MFKAIDSRKKYSEMEREVINFWREDNTFNKSVEQRDKKDSYVFYDGPPFITGVPHYGTLLSSIVKDVVPRYWTMKGKRVERRWGWDCHGLPAENLVEKKVGIKDKRDIPKIGLEKYIQTCRSEMVQGGCVWEDTIERIGRWVEFKNAYKTMDKEYMESVWWAFKQLYEKGKIYEGEKVLMYCTRCATPISKAEVAMDNSYKIVTDPSVFVKFQLKGEEKTYLLAWTTTPWTLSANVALAINPQLAYIKVILNGESLIVAKDLVEKVFIDEKKQPLNYSVGETIDGADLLNKKYEPLFENHGESAHRIIGADFVTTENGTGIVHIAPAFGEDDYTVAMKEKLPVVHTVDENGNYIDGRWKDQNVWEVNKEIAKTLLTEGIVLKIDYIQHDYPHCHRCSTKLMYRAHPSWFMDVDGQRTDMLSENTEHINWFPDHIKHGRFEKTIETAPDWNLSRDRFWATAMPVWKGIDKDGNDKIKVIGSYAELKELSGVELEDYHRPWVDNITFTIDGVKYTRIDKVMDCWFESGSMPFAQFHYPFENVEKFEQNFPGDFIVEYVGQVRAWFYYVHAVNVGLFGHNAYKNVIVTGNVAGNDGRKMSKSYGNFTDPNVLMDKFSADSLRFLLLASPLLSGEDFALQDKEVGDVARKLSMVWNMYDFFTMYAEVDKWEFKGDLSDPTEGLTNNLDIWVISRLHQLTAEIEKNMDVYDIPNAMKPILPFIEDASNWYVRRSRRRFWKAGDNTDKNNAYRTLHYVLVQLAQVLAPFTPFLAEELYQKLTGGESVHLIDWPKVGHIDELVVSDMETVRDYVNQGLSIRAKEHQKVRQPLASVTVPALGKFVDFEDILTEELNVKSVKLGSEFALDLVITPELKSEGIAREVIRYIQGARKEAGLNIEDRIKLVLKTENAELKLAISDNEKTITDETLTTELLDKGSNKFATEVKLDGVDLTVSLQKA